MQLHKVGQQGTGIAVNRHAAFLTRSVRRRPVERDTAIRLGARPSLARRANSTDKQFECLQKSEGVQSSLAFGRYQVRRSTASR